MGFGMNTTILARAGHDCVLHVTKRHASDRLTASGARNFSLRCDNSPHTNKGATVKIAILLFSLVTFSAATTIVSAEEKPQFREGPCQSDIKNLCGPIEPGKGGIARCLKEHEDKISDECRHRIEDAKQKLTQAKEACREDAEKFCKDIQPGEGKIVRCLKEHEASLSEKCRNVPFMKGTFHHEAHVGK